MIRWFRARGGKDAEPANGSDEPQWEEHTGAALRAHGLEEGAAQAARLAAKARNAVEVLGQRFEPGELTHVRYEQAIERCVASLRRNFREMEIAMHTASGIDRARAELRISELRQVREPSAQAREEIAQCRERRRMFADALGEVRDRLAKNEVIAISIDRISDELSRSGHEEIEREASDAVRDATELAERVSRYDR